MGKAFIGLLLMASSLFAGEVPAELRGNWQVESLSCGGKPLSKGLRAQISKPNALLFHLTKDKGYSEWKKKKCRYNVYYEFESSGPGKLSGRPTGETKCDPKKCMPVCDTQIPIRVSVPFDFQIKKKRLTISSSTGLECILQGLPPPAEAKLIKLK